MNQTRNLISRSSPIPCSNLVRQPDDHDRGFTIDLGDYGVVDPIEELPRGGTSEGDLDLGLAGGSGVRHLEVGRDQVVGRVTLDRGTTFPMQDVRALRVGSHGRFL